MRDVLLVLTGLFFGIAMPLYYQKLRPDPWQQLQWRDSASELILVYIGSPTCGPSNAPELPALLATARHHLATSASEQGFALRTIGIAISRNLRMGLDHLHRMGPFHEVAIGARWESFAFRYVQSIAPGLRATPQIVLLVRQEGTFRLLLRRVGLDDIKQWVEAGMPFPSLSASLSTS